MSNRLLKLLPILLAFALICSVSVFAVLADESVSEDATETEDATSGDESAGEESVSEETSAPADESDSDESETSDAEDETSAGQTNTSSTSSTSSTASDSHAGHDHGAETSGGLSARTWQLIITAAVVVILVAVLFILSKTNTKIGQKIANFFKNNKSEIKKVVWMPKNDLVKSTGIVLLVLVVACALIGLLDFAFSSVLNLLSSIG